MFLLAIHMLKLYPHLNILVYILINICLGTFMLTKLPNLLLNILVCFIELGSTYHRRVLKFCIIQFCFQELTIVMLCGKYLRDRIERVQTRSARAILRVPVRTNCEYLCQKMGWKTLEERRNYHLNLSVFKCLSGLAPPSMCNYFTLVSDSHKLNTRSSTLGKIRPMKPSLEYGKRSFQYRGGLAWNNLHSAINSIQFKLIIYPMPRNTSNF